MSDDQDPADEPAKDEPAADLGTTGKATLDKERRARREAERNLRDVQAQLQQLQDKDKSDSERLTEQVTTLTKERDAALLDGARLKAAVTKGLSEDHAKRVMGAARRISGDTPEDLEVDASDYFESLGATSGESGPAPGKPTEALSGGGHPTQEPPVDVRAVVESIPRGF